MILALALACGPAAPPTIGERFGDRPFLTPIDAPSTVALTAGGTLPTDAATCGSCHADNYGEWKDSTHANAIHDLQFIAELAKADNPRWLCINCHAPTQPQRRALFTLDTPMGPDIRTIASTENPDFHPERTGEGVTCAVCHVRRDADGQGVIVGPFGSAAAPHRVRQDLDALTNVCVRCHSPGPAVISPTLFCWFETAEELARSPNAGQSCPDCHMPGVQRPLVAGMPSRPSRRHTWVGGGVPKHPEGYDTLLERGFLPGVRVTTTLRPTPTGGPDVRLTQLPVTIKLANQAGHSLPTADPERYLRVEARVEAADGTVIGRDVLRIGQRWDWGDAATGRQAHRTADERIGPGQTRSWSPSLPVPDAPGATLVVEALHVRLSPRNAEGMATTALDPELLELWPEAATLLPHIATEYPLATYVWAERVPVDGGPATRDDPATLIARSRALVDLPLAEKEARITAP